MPPYEIVLHLATILCCRRNPPSDASSSLISQKERFVDDIIIGRFVEWHFSGPALLPSTVTICYQIYAQLLIVLGTPLWLVSGCENVAGNLRQKWYGTAKKN